MNTRSPAATALVACMWVLVCLQGAAAAANNDQSLVDDLANPALRGSAKERLTDLGARAIPTLAKALESPTVDVRVSACAVLGRLNTPRAADPLEKALRDPDERVRATAAVALGQLGSRRSRRILTILLSDPSPRARGAAAYSLGLLGDSADADKIAALLRDRDASARALAAKALELIRSRRTAKALYEALRFDTSPAVRANAAAALGAMAAPEATGALIAGLSDTSQEGADACYYALARITGRDFGGGPGSSRQGRLAAQRRWFAWYAENYAELGLFNGETPILSTPPARASTRPSSAAGDRRTIAQRTGRRAIRPTGDQERTAITEVSLPDAVETPGRPNTPQAPTLSESPPPVLEVARRTKPRARLGGMGPSLADGTATGSPSQPVRNERLNGVRSAQVLFALGAAHYANGRYSEAADCYEKAARAEPSLRGVYFNLALAYQRLGSTDRARDAYEKALAADPSDTSSLNNLGVLLVKDKRLSEAEPILRRLVRLDPNRASARFNLAEVLRVQGKPAEALQQYKFVLENPASTTSGFGPSVVEARIAECRRLMKRNTLSLSRGDVHARNTETARTTGAAAAEKNPLADAEWYKDVQAVVRAKEAVKRNPASAAARAALARAYCRCGRRDLALEQAEKAVELAPAEKAYKLLRDLYSKP